MGISDVISLLGGIALFLFGMSLMGEGLKKVAGSKLELVLYRLSSTPLKGVLLGTGVTAVIQSSSATSVMVVGFVNSGMMKVRQAIGVIMGAILGTSITGWILCLSSISGGSGLVQLLSTEVLTGIVAVAGIILRMFSAKTSHRHVGEILLGFAVLMYGMSAMSGAVSPLRESESFIRILTSFSNPLLGILVGIAFTSILQSASAAVGILQALSITGAITFEIAFPIIMGVAIGAAVPVLLSALGANLNGKRTAFVYLLIDVLGVVIWSLVFYTLNAIFRFPFLTRIMTSVSIAFLNTLFPTTAPRPRTRTWTAWRSASSSTPPCLSSRAVSSPTPWPSAPPATCWTPWRCAPISPKRASMLSARRSPLSTATRTSWAPIS